MRGAAAGRADDHRVERAVTELAEGFLARFPSTPREPRRVGREAEFPVVRADGTAIDASPLWPALVDATGGRPIRDPAGPLVGVELERWFCVAEVGRATVEIGVGPRTSLHGLARDLEDALDVVVPLAAERGMRLLGHGIHPMTPPRAGLMTPKARYEALVRAIGTGWVRWTVTASDQLHVDVGRDEVIPAADAINAVSGAIVALTANSGVLGGRLGADASSREALSARVSGERFRNGAVPVAFGDAAGYVRWTTGFRALVLPDGRGGFRLPGVPYRDLLARREEPDLEEWLYHEHYLWPSARPRARLGTLEIRPACQQPAASFAASALSLGLVEAWRDVAALVDDLGPDARRRLVAFRGRAVRRGMAAEEPAGDFLLSIVDAAAEGLSHRGLGEEAFLDPIRERLAARRGPADEAREAFVRAGGPGVVEHAALRP